jgi:aspartyl-tRNA(Asn)/glutamyl-tRNA(Gln) amidotransferase subunit C
MDVKHVAKLANIQLLDGEEAKFVTQFEDTLKTVQIIDELDTQSVRPTAQVTGRTNVTREDKIDSKRILPQDSVIGQAKASHNGYIKVPAIFDAQ